MYKTILIAFFLIHYISVLGQVTVTGHVSAEVIESVAIQNELRTSFSLTDSENSLDLGSLKVAAIEKYECDISVSNTIIYNDQSAYPLNMDYASNKDAGKSSGDISFTASSMEKIHSGNYDGELTIVVSFN